MSVPGSRRVVAAAMAATALALGVAPGEARSADPSTWTREERATFLEQAEVVDLQRLDVGVTRSFHARLRLDGVEHDAHWQTIEVTRTMTRIGGRIHRDFKDSYLFNVAAYELDRLLGLDMVPVTVLRKVKGQGRGAMAWWIDDVHVMEKDRAEQGLVPPDIGRWNRQKRRYACFQQLIANIDPNATNILFTTDWRMWLIDFTRAFRTHVGLMDAPELRPVDAELLNALERLDKKEVRRALGELLTAGELSALLRRRDRIVTRLHELEK